MKKIMICFTILLAYQTSIAQNFTPLPRNGSNQTCTLNDPRPECNGQGSFGDSNSNVPSCPAGQYPQLIAGQYACLNYNNSQEEQDPTHVDTRTMPTRPGAIGGTEPDPFEDSVQASCLSAYKSAKRNCKNVEYSGMGSQLLTQFSQLKAAGNMKEACGLAKKISVASIGSNTTFGVMCQRTSSLCETSCDPKKNASGNRALAAEYQRYYMECQEFGGNALTGYLQAGNDAVQFLASKACEDAADAKCIGQKATSDPDCAQFCTIAGRETHPKCQLAASSCANATFYSQNAQFCQCLSTPNAVGCNTSTFSGTTGNSALSNLANANGGLGTSDANDYLGNESKGPNGSGTEGGNGSSSGFNGGGGGSYALPSEGSGGGNGDDPLNKDILTGSGGGSSGGAAGGFFGYGGGEGSGASKSGSGSNAEGSGGIDLKAFLPGGKNDPRRAPASDTFEAAGITKSDGLTNFQKITRKINQKLMQGELTP